MTIVTAMTIWIVQFENGGLLNVLFTTAPNSTGEPNFYLAHQFNYEYFVKIFLGRSPPLPILQALPEAIGGGQAGVANAHSRPNRQALIYWVSVTILLFFVNLLFNIQIINCHLVKKVSSF